MKLLCQKCADEGKVDAALPKGTCFCPHHGEKGIPLEDLVITQPNVCPEGGGHLIYPVTDFCPIHGVPIDHNLRITVRQRDELAH